MVVDVGSLECHARVTEGVSEDERRWEEEEERESGHEGTP
jgi:hypothetical protein